MSVLYGSCVSSPVQSTLELRCQIFTEFSPAVRLLLLRWCKGIRSMAEVCIGDLPVLVFAPFGKDATLIARVLRQSAMNICTGESLQELQALISENAGAAIISEEVLQNGAIGTLAQRISAQPPWSDFAIIVLTGGGLSTASTESAVRSRAPLGNVTLLERPLRPVTLISAVRSALLARRRQYEVREHLRQREAAEEALRRAHDALETLVDRSISDTRTLSHLLHPPLLDEAGFLSAAKWYVEGFGRRSGIVTKLDL